MRVEFLPAAEREFREAARYEARTLGLGQEFVSEVEHACAVPSEHTALGPQLNSRHRRLSLRRFPFALIYRVDSAVIRIVADQRRRPGYWASRR